MLYSAFFISMIMGIHGVRGLWIFLDSSFPLAVHFMYPMIWNAVKELPSPSVNQLVGLIQQIFPYLGHLVLISIILLLQFVLSVIWFFSMLYGMLIFRSQLLIIWFQSEHFPWQ